MAPIEKVAMRITRLRERKKWTKRQLAEAAGVSYGYLWRLEAARHDPTLSVLEKLARALGVKVETLVK
jgi:transcriptional regulator with XRE-family HTH domain